MSFGNRPVFELKLLKWPKCFSMEKVNKVNNKFQNWLLVIRMSLESLYKSKKWAQSPEPRARQFGHFDLKKGKIMTGTIVTQNET